MGAVFNKITELFSKLKDGAGNLLTSTDLGDGKQALDVNAELDDDTAVKIKDGTTDTNTVAVDSDGNLSMTINGGDTTVLDGGVIKILVSNFEVDGLLTKILKELIKMNVYLESMTDLNISNKDIMEDL